MDRSGLSFLESVINILTNAGVFEPEKKNVPVVEFEHPLALKVSIRVFDKYFYFDGDKL